MDDQESLMPEKVARVVAAFESYLRSSPEAGPIAPVGAPLGRGPQPQGYSFSVRRAAGSIRCELFFLEFNLVLCQAIADIAIPAARMPQAIKLIARANAARGIGTFTLDLESGELCCKESYDFDDIALTEAHLRTLVALLADAIAALLPALRALVDRGAAVALPARAVARVVAGGLASAHTQRTIEALESYLLIAGWGHAYAGGPPVYTMQYLDSTGYIVRCRAEISGADMFLFAATPDLRIPAERLAPALELVTRANHALALYALALDMDDGTLHSRGGYVFTDIALNYEHFQSLISTLLQTLSAFLPVLRDVVERGAAPQQAMRRLG